MEEDPKDLKARVEWLEEQMKWVGNAVTGEVLRSDADRAIIFAIALGFVNNIKADGVEPGRNADLFMQAVEMFAGFDLEDPASPERFRFIKQFGELLVSTASQWDSEAK